MRREPKFWRHEGFMAALLSPAAVLYAAATAHRLHRSGWRAPVPVICCGNAVVGGAGKTTVAIDLIRALAARGIAVHALSRGYGGREHSPLQVDPLRHEARAVGDEALLLAAEAPCWVASDRASGARAAVAAGAEAIVMDDGLQNPSLKQDLPLLVIDGEAGFGNGRVIPAGPLREPVAAAAGRARAAVLIGEDRSAALTRLPPSLPVLRAHLVMDVSGFESARVVAFAGIARPEKFFSGLEAAGIRLAEARGFPDHHRYRQAELAALLHEAKGLALVTTAKDAVRLSLSFRSRVRVIPVRLEWENRAARDALLAGLIPAAQTIDSS